MTNYGISKSLVGYSFELANNLETLNQLRAVDYYAFHRTFIKLTEHLDANYFITRTYYLVNCYATFCAKHGHKLNELYLDMYKQFDKLYPIDLEDIVNKTKGMNSVEYTEFVRDLVYKKKAALAHLTHHFKMTSFAITGSIEQTFDNFLYTYIQKNTH